MTQLMVKKWHVKCTFIEPLLGTVSKNKAVYATYIASLAEKAVTESGEPPDIEDEIASVTEREESGWTGFHEDPDGAYLYDYQVKGFLKEAGNVLKDIVKVKNLRSKIDSYTFVRPRKIRLASVGEPLERPLRAQTAQGPRVTLVRSDTVAAGSTIEFDIVALPHKELDGDLLHTLLSYGEMKGLGQWRNGGFGSFTFEVEETL